MAAFFSVDSEAGLKKLDDYLLSRSYITGYQASKDDMALYSEILVAPPSKYSNVVRWYIHIDALLKLSGGTAEGQGVKVTSSAFHEASTPDVADGKDNEDLHAEQAANANTVLSDMPLEIIEKLLNHVLCRADRARLRCANKFWKGKVDNAKKPMQLPWLLLPSTTKPMYYNTAGQALHNLRLPHNIRRATRIAGAYEGDWIFLADYKEGAPHRHVLYNLSTGCVIPLPEQMVYDGERTTVTMRTATLAGCPDSPEGYVVVAILLLPHCFVTQAAFCNESMQLWEDCGNVASQRLGAGDTYIPFDLDLVDVVHIRGSFYLLTDDEEVMRLVLDVDHTVQPGSGLQMQLRKDFMADNLFDREDGQHVFRYLVPLARELLMVVRYIQGGVTIKVRVFKLQYVDDQAYWTEQGDLPGHKVFVGHGCSRCYKVGEDELSVYFYDDREEPLMMNQYYWRTDSGMATLSEVGPWPLIAEDEQIDPTSERSPPAWWLHWECPGQ